MEKTYPSLKIISIEKTMDILAKIVIIHENKREKEKPYIELIP